MTKSVHRAATYEDVLNAPEGMTAQIVDGVLETQPRTAFDHATTSYELGVSLGRFGRGRGGPGGWVIVAEPEIHLGTNGHACQALGVLLQPCFLEQSTRETGTFPSEIRILPPMSRMKLASLALAVSSSLVACGGSTQANGSPVSSSGGETTESVLPAGFVPAQGEHAFGVYILIVPDTDTDGSTSENALAELAARGVSGGVGQLSCDQGASAVLGASEDDVVVSVDFRTREDAERFVAAWGSPVVGVAEFVAFCRD